MNTEQLKRHIQKSDPTALEKRYLEGLVEARTPREGMRLIDAEALKKQFSEYRENLRSCHYTPLALSVADDMIDYADEAPTIEAEPVRHGRWIEDDDGETVCSECNGVPPNGWYWKYCPHCSAKMDGKENEHEK